MATDGDIQTQRRTYEKLNGMMKVGGVICLSIAFVVVCLISGK